MGHKLSSNAEANLDDIWVYVATRSGSIDVAEEFVESLIKRFRMLSLHPYAGRRCGGEWGSETRVFPVGKYLIFYDIEVDGVLILNVVRGSRDIEALLNR